MSLMDLFTDTGPFGLYDGMTWEEIDSLNEIEHLDLDTLNSLAATEPDCSKLFDGMWHVLPHGKEPCWAVRHYAPYVRHDEPTICIKHFTMDELRDLIRLKCDKHNAYLKDVIGHGYEHYGTVDFKLRSGTEVLRFTVRVDKRADARRALPVFTREEFVRAVLKRS